MDDKRPPLRLSRVADERARLLRLIGGDSWDWPAMVSRLPLGGIPRMLAERLSVRAVRGGPAGTLYFSMSLPRPDVDLITRDSLRLLADALEADAGVPVDLAVMLDD